MTKFKVLSLLCLVILLFSGGCSNPTAFYKPSTQVDNLDVTERSVKKETKTPLQKAKEAIVLLSASPNSDPLNPDTSRNSLCTGISINELGHIITNFHCIYQQKVIKLIYYSEDDYEFHDVKIIGTDPLADLALLEVVSDMKPKYHITMAEAPEDVAEGDEVFALGHPMGMAWTLTKGIVSSNERYSRHPYIKTIQTDAAINKGNSGGPLLNSKFELVGINTFIISRVLENAGVGLAVRGDVVKKSIERMLLYGTVDRPAIGVMIHGLTNSQSRDKIMKEFPQRKQKYIPNTLGLYVKPSLNMPAGIQAHDTIIGVEGVLINDGVQFSDELGKYNVGDTISLMIIRRRVFKEIVVTLKPLPVNAQELYNQMRPTQVP